MTPSRPTGGAPARGQQPDLRHDPRPRPSEERAIRGARTTRWVAVAALVVAAAGLGLAAWGTLARGSGGCQDQAWDVAPATGDLPAGWTVSASQYDVGRKQMTFVGPVPQDELSSQAVVYATITCFPDGAAEAVSRSADAATEAGQLVTQRTDLGEQAFTASDPSGATFIQLRRGPVVVYLAASGDATAAEAEGVASAFDIATGGDGAEIAARSPDSSAALPIDDLESLAPGEPAESASPAAPELVAALPTSVGDLELTVDSATGVDILGEDQGSRAIAAALRDAGRSPDDLRVAQAYDPNGVTDLSILAVRVDGMPLDALTSLVLDSWLAATGAGVTREEIELGGRTVTRIDYGDLGSKSYLLAAGDVVRIIETADADLAARVVAALP